jgi:hypothetical protein
MLKFSTIDLHQASQQIKKNNVQMSKSKTQVAGHQSDDRFPPPFSFGEEFAGHQWSVDADKQDTSSRQDIIVPSHQSICWSPG